MSLNEDNLFYVRVSWWYLLNHYGIFSIYIFALFEASGHLEHIPNFTMCVLAIVFLVSIFAFNLFGAISILCDKRKMKVINPLFIGRDIDLLEVKKIEIISEGNWLGIIRVFHPKDILGYPTKILTRTFPKAEMVKLIDLLKHEAAEAQILYIDLLKDGRSFKKNW